MQIQNKWWESESLVRFPDCDPFNHLNNARYLDYFINAREDQLVQFAAFNIYEMAQQTGLSWVVSKSQIAYLRPAYLMEKLVIQSRVLKLGQRDLLVEMLMWNIDRSVLKSLLWTQFNHFNLKTQRPQEHTPELMERFAPFEDPLPEELNFDQRLEQVKNRKPA